VEDRCFSGSILIEPDRAIAIYHGVGAGTMAATSSDPLLLDWTKVGGKPVIPCPVMWQTNLGPEQLPDWKGSPAPREALNLVYDPCIWKNIKLLVKGQSKCAFGGLTAPHAQLVCLKNGG
jgi:hypothetical protein